MMAEQVKPFTFDPPYHPLNTSTQSKLDAHLKEYESQFVKDEIFIRTTPLTSMMINMASKGHSQQQIKLVSTDHCSTQG